ncbi:hypothetical protein SAMN05444156_0750 [Verrucomicrobium sp. GAS474]|uniref:hypothetical protein n=1 Tax=Verrucomicrobium sp. GAS474 TaxID=1882831 RepID=UPI00087ACAE4|nr:hypothetical protein [Verrucomicrobium sp. GAS474]SDT92039.1 hypothetical protein SAMN05444156_0750 [Verrucomicrobium sp. GAS474]
MKAFKLLSLAFSLATAVVFSSSAATLIDYNMGTASFTGIGLYAGYVSAPGTVIPGVNGTSTVTAVNYTASSLSIGQLYGVGSSSKGLPPLSLYFSTANSTTGIVNEFSTATQADAITGQDYLAFTVTPSSGYAINVSTLTFEYERDGTSGVSTAASNWFLMSSADNFTTALASGTMPTVQSAGVYNFSLVTATLSGNSALQNVTSSTTFELYFYGSSPTGTDGFRLDEITLTGAVVAVPEVPVWALALLGLPFLFLVVRRRRALTV